MKLFKHKQSGFSLIEILAVLFVVSMSMLGVISLIIQNIQAQSINKNNLIASSLAQEGIELIRQTRDANWRAGRAFDYNLSAGTYKIDYRLNAPLPVTSISDAKIYLQNGFYVNDTGTEVDISPTIFNREIFLDKPVGYIGAPLQVRVIITWTDSTRSSRYELRTLLFDWK